MSVLAFNEVHVYRHIGLMQPKCLTEQVLGLSRNIFDHRRCMVFNFEKVGTPYDDVGLDFEDFV